MVSLELTNQLVKSIQFDINLTGSTEIQIEQTFLLEIKYLDSLSKCVAIFRYIVKEKAETPRLLIDVTLNGFFDCTGIETEEDKKDVHIQAYNILFPCVQSAIHLITSMAGLPPIPMKKTMKNENIEVK